MKSKDVLSREAIQLRNRFGVSDGPIKIFDVVIKQPEITLIRYPAPIHLSGMCYKIEDAAMIVINSNLSYGRQCFTLAHELYHIYYDLAETSICINEDENKSDIEKEADLFASYFLLPATLLERCMSTFVDYTIESIIVLEQYITISHQALVLRLEEDGYIGLKTKKAYLEANIRRMAESLGYKPTLYMPSSKKYRYYTQGRYLRLVNTLYKDHKISTGKREELLLKIYRSDLVYGKQ